MEIYEQKELYEKRLKLTQTFAYKCSKNVKTKSIFPAAEQKILHLNPDILKSFKFHLSIMKDIGIQHKLSRQSTSMRDSPTIYKPKIQ